MVYINFCFNTRNLYLLSSEKGGVDDLQICGCDVDLTQLAASEGEAPVWFR